MSQEVCNCHLNNFSHWKFLILREKYDLGIKAHFDRIASEPHLLSYVSIIQISHQAYNDWGSLSVVLTRTIWRQREVISAVKATTELQGAAGDLDSEAAQFLIGIADEEIPRRLKEFDDTGTLDRSEIFT
jgi:hypothetical protein